MVLNENRINSRSLDFQDVMLIPNVSDFKSRKEAALEVTYHFKNDTIQWTGIPIIAANMDTVGTFEVAKVLGDDPYNMLTCIHKHYSFREWEKFIDSVAKKPQILKNVMYSIGNSKEDLAKIVTVNRMIEIKGLGEYRPKFLCIDVANGYSSSFHDFIDHVESIVGDQLVIVAGNVCDSLGSDVLSDHGAEIVKLGIGSGSVCTTRDETGFGRPMLDTVIDCVESSIVQDFICDGGCSNPGDIFKAFCFGAKFVMLGGMFAGCIEGSTKEFYGMSSKKAREKHGSGVDDYRSSEGRVLTFKRKKAGSVADVAERIVRGLRSACTYAGDHLKDVIGNDAVDYVVVNRQHTKVPDSLGG